MPSAPFDRWLDAAVARHVPPLAFSDVRKGVQALSSLYVERRAAGDLGARSGASAAKRAALVSYYAPLHFLAAREAAARLGEGALAGVRRVFDLGGGSGAVGAALATAAGGAPRLVVIDRSGWALSEARHTWRAFGLAGSSRRGVLPEALPRAGRGDLLLLGWVVNELEAPARERLLEGLAEAAARGAAVLVLEPLSGRVSPWWEGWVRRLAGAGGHEERVKTEAEVPDWIARLDEAAGLDHSLIGARVLALNLPPAPHRAASPDDVTAADTSLRDAPRRGPVAEEPRTP